MAKAYDPIMCMMVDEPTKAQDELSLAQKKQVVTELKGYLKKSYNFSDESEYARAYEDLRHMFTTGSRKSISGLFENTVKKTGAHDANKYVEQAIKWMKEGKGRLYILSGLKQMGLTPIDAAKYYAEANAETGYKARDVAPATQRYINTIVDESKANAEKFVRQAEQDDEVPENELKYVYKAYNEKFGYRFHDSASALDKAIKACDAVEVETSEWSFSSGKSKPSGLGNWWFKIGTEEKNFYGNWSNVKAEAIKYAKEKGINRISLMT